MRAAATPGLHLAFVLNIASMRRLQTGKSGQHADAYETIFSALAHPVRRRILMTLNFEGGCMSAGEIAQMFEHAWPTTTRHVQLLVAAGLLRHERQGRSRMYHIDKKQLGLVRDWLAWFFED